MHASLPHFLEVVNRIRRNSWFSERVLTGKTSQFTLTASDGKASISAVPTESFESLLLNIRKLTSGKAPEELTKIQKHLKRTATDSDRELLDVWQKYWRIAFIKEPFLIQSNGRSEPEIITPYRAYNAFINGYHFHSNDESHNLILHGGSPVPSGFDTNLYLQNIFHGTVCNFAFAALGLERYIRHGSTFVDLPLVGVGVADPVVVMEFVFCQNQISEMDEQYRIFSKWIDDNGGCENCRWK
jgi:hypothetical protein